MPVASNQGIGVTSFVKRWAKSSLNKVKGALVSNQWIGPSVKAAQNAAKPFTSTGGARGVASLIRNALAAEQAGLSQAADMAFSEAMSRVGALAKAPLAAAKAYVSPAGGVGLWAGRMGRLGGGMFIAGSAWRMATGSGTPVTDDRGKFDIAGIPFI